MDRTAIFAALGAVLTLFGAGAAHTLRHHQVDPDESVDLVSVPLQLGTYAGMELEVTPRVLEELRSDALLLREYQSVDEPPLWVYVDYHRAQRLGAQIHSPRNCYPGAGWNVIHAEILKETEGRETLPVCWLELENDQGERRVAGFWFETRWGKSTDELALKRDLLRSAFSRKATDAALVRLSTDADVDGREEARARIRSFIQELVPQLRTELPFETSRSSSPL